ncbi:unnamed protein product [[Candida] boidinii]|nr:unnamed protein product [[Candida] boidinii]
MPRGQVSDSDYQACVQILHDLRVVDLKTICRSLGIHLNGKKTELHQRIQTQLLKARHSSDNIKLYAFIKIISDVSQGIEPLSFQVIYSNFQQSDSYGMNSINSSTSQLNNHLYSSSIGSPVTFGHTHAMTGSSSTSAGVVNNQASVKPWLYFYESPFFKLKRLLTTDKSFSNPAFAYKCPDKRGETHIKFTLKDSEKELLSNSDKYRLYLLSGVYNNKSTSNKNHIAFPSPLELHLNNNEIKDNVKGIKGKEGTSKPADLTPYLKLDSSNHMKVVYAFAKTDYLIYLYIVEVTPISEIVKQVLDQPRISKTSSIHLLKESMGDEDLVQTLETIPLSCPLSLLRIETPCRSIKCKHLRCFDLFFFISMVKRTPNWVCPICNNEIKLSELAVDEYMVDILRNTTRDVISVELQEDGGWKPHEIDQEELDDDDLPNHNTTNNNNNNNNNSVAQDGTGANGNNITNNNTPSVNDHPSSSHEPIEIISLDSSDEEEEPPVADIANDTTPAPAVDPAPADTATTTTTHMKDNNKSSNHRNSSKNNSNSNKISNWSQNYKHQ